MKYKYQPDISLNSEEGIAPNKRRFAEISALAAAINLTHSRNSLIDPQMLPLYISDKVRKGEEPPKHYRQVIKNCRLCLRLAKIYENALV